MLIRKGNSNITYALLASLRFVTEVIECDITSNEM